MQRTHVRVVLALALLAAGAPPAFAAKTDIVELINGDRITCEIKKLDRGKLSVKTDGLGTISIEWDDIRYIASPTSFNVDLATGERTFGSLGRGDARTVDIIATTGTTRTERPSLDDIVRLVPLGANLWQRLDGSISAGFNFTEANSQTQWTFDTTVSYRGRRWLSQLSADSLLTTNDDTDRQTRNNLSVQSQRYIRPRWSTIGFLQFQQNEELSLDLRALVGAGVARTVAQSNRTTAALIGGIAFTTEQYVGDEDERIAEAVAAVSWEWFTFDGRSTNLSTSAHTFYALNGDSRVRAELNASFKSDIVGDLYWSVNAFESYNSRPPTDQKASDFGVSATMGWSF
jgi:hypothetical protein